MTLRGQRAKLGIDDLGSVTSLVIGKLARQFFAKICFVGSVSSHCAFTSFHFTSFPKSRAENRSNIISKIRGSPVLQLRISKSNMNMTLDPRFPSGKYEQYDDKPRHNFSHEVWDYTKAESRKSMGEHPTKFMGRNIKASIRDRRSRVMRLRREDVREVQKKQ